ncbi:MAG: hypothetical protein QME16_05860, partial [Planctomycetota bacterium]|nr:hypothetical protein [Planctomycetota bacterium]
RSSARSASAETRRESGAGVCLRHPICHPEPFGDVPEPFGDVPEPLAVLPKSPPYKYYSLRTLCLCRPLQAGSILLGIVDNFS